MNKFVLKKLVELSNIGLSNIDKKTRDYEKKVTLCNFVDVYKNWAITKDLESTLMKSSASDNQIEKFLIRKGQVAITKDSEKRDDIGISTYIADNLSNAVLGYHCALITPHKEKLSGKFLNVVLHSPYALKYWEMNASGSGQRYSLSRKSIEEFPIPVFDIVTQENVGNFFSFIDKKIELNNKINKELEKFAKDLYDYWFVQFDFPDENKRPYKSSGGKMVYNSVLKRKIPEGWKVKSIGNICNLYQPETISEKDCIDNGQYYVYGSNKIIGKYNQKNHNESEIIISCRGNCGNVTRTLPNVWITGNAMVIHPREDIGKEFIYFTLKNAGIKRIITGSVQGQITRKNLTLLNLIIPPKELLNRFNELTLENINLRINTRLEIDSLSNIRDFLLPMLMNGQITVSD